MKAIQQPLTGIPQIENVFITREKLPPRELLLTQAKEPDFELVQNIAENWILEPIVIVRDSNGLVSLSPFEDVYYSTTWNFYPIAGHRRTLSIDQLIASGWKDPVTGEHAYEKQIPAILLPDVNVIDGMRLMYRKENLKSPNLTNELAIIKREAEHLCISLFDDKAAKAIAQSLGMPKMAGTIKKKIKMALLDDEFIQAQRNGQITTETLIQIAGLNIDDRFQAAKALAEGKKLSSKDIHQFHVAEKLVTLKGQAIGTEEYDFSFDEVSLIGIKKEKLKEWHTLLWNTGGVDMGNVMAQVAQEIAEILGIDEPEDESK